MATAVLRPAPQIVAHRVDPAPRGLMSWLTTTDHKRIGILYLVTSFVFFILGGTEALMIRLQLGEANNTLVTPEVYNQLFTARRWCSCSSSRCSPASATTSYR
jgi:hypothetical protein